MDGKPNINKYQEMNYETRVAILGMLQGAVNGVSLGLNPPSMGQIVKLGVNVSKWQP